MRESAAADDRRFEPSSLSPPATSGPTGAGVVVFASLPFRAKRRPTALVASEERKVGAEIRDPSSKVERGRDRGDAR